MQEHIYKFNSKKVFNQSFLIAFFNISFIIVLIYCIKKVHLSGPFLILLPITVLGTICIPGIFLFFNYLKFSLHKNFILSDKFVQLVDTKTLKEIKFLKKDIQQIELHINYSSSKLPWFNYEYFSIISNDNEKIIVTSF